MTVSVTDPVVFTDKGGTFEFAALMMHELKDNVNDARQRVSEYKSGKDSSLSPRRVNGFCSKCDEYVGSRGFCYACERGY